MKESMGDRIKRLRLQHNLTQEELGNKVGLKRAAINKYEKGNVENMKRSIIEKMSSVFDVSPSYLMALDENYDNSQKNNQNILKIYNKLEEPRQKKVYRYAENQLHEQESSLDDDSRNVSYLNKNNNFSKVAENQTPYASKKIFKGRATAAGYAIDGDTQDTELYIEEADFKAIPKSADEIVTIAGDSMEPVYPKYSEVFIRHQPVIESGEVAILHIQDEGVTCKVVYDEGENYRLVSYNEEYDDMIYPKEEIRIIGKVLT